MHGENAVFDSRIADSLAVLRGTEPQIGGPDLNAEFAVEEDREVARPQPRSSTLIPGRRSSADVSHSAIQSGFAAPLMLARSHSGLYCEARGNRSEMVGWAEIVWVSVLEL